MSYRSGSRDDNKSGSIMDENNRDHCQVFDGSGEKLSMEVFCEKVSEMHCKKNLFQRKNLQRITVRLNFWRILYWSTSGTFSKTFCSLTAILPGRAAITWWYFVCSAEILQIENWDSVCWNHILAPSAQNWGSLRKTEQVLAMPLLTRGHHFRG